MQTQSHSERNQPESAAGLTVVSVNSSDGALNPFPAAHCPWHRRCIANVLERLTGRMTSQVIHSHMHLTEGDGGEERNPYLHRFTLYRSKRFGIYLQKIVGKPAAQFHNHPWRLVTVVLTGSYQERYLGVGLIEHQRTVRWLSRKAPNDFHIVDGAAPRTWTLVFTRQQVQARGFLSGVNGDQAEYVTPSPLAVNGKGKGRADDEHFIVQ